MIGAENYWLAGSGDVLLIVAEEKGCPALDLSLQLKKTEIRIEG